MSLIVVGTQVLIWEVKREATPGQEPMIENAVNRCVFDLTGKQPGTMEWE